MSLLAQVSRVSLGQLPEYLDALALKMMVFQLEFTSKVSPQCTDHPYWKEISLAITSISAILATMLLSVCFKSFKSKCRAVAKQLFNVLISILCVSYPQLVHYTVKNMHCVPNKHEGGVDVLYSNGLAQCFVGEHTTAFIWGIVALFMHGILFPCVTFFVLKNIVKEGNILDQEAMEQHSHWRYFLHHVYKPHMFWFRHIDLLLLVFTEIANEFVSKENPHAYWVCLSSMLILVGGLFVCKQPFSDSAEWATPIKVYQKLCVLLYITTNYCSVPSSFFSHGKYQLHWLAPLTMGAVILLFLLLIFCFGKTLLDGATLEEEQIQWGFAHSLLEIAGNDSLQRKFGNYDDVLNVSLLQKSSQDTPVKQTNKSGLWFRNVKTKAVELIKLKSRKQSSKLDDL
jgi:hypothetical protein